MRLANGIISDLNENEMIALLIKRVCNFFLISEQDRDLIHEKHTEVLTLLKTCFVGVDNKYFRQDGEVYFSSSHSGQYLIYLYLYSRVFSEMGHELKDKFYYLNKIMHSVDIYSEVRLPSVFFFEHPLGLVLGRAEYGSNFFAMQGCTVGGNKGKYPIIGNNVKMFSNSKIVGDSNIGDNVWLAANSYVKDSDIPSNSIVFGQYPDLVIKKLII